MKITTIKLLAFALAITLVVGGALLLLPDHSHAQVVCPSTSTNDFDADGLLDLEECNGITLLDNAVVTGLLQCPAGANRNSCLDPNSKDVFVILVKPNGSVIDSIMSQQDPLEILKGTGVNGTKLSIGIHGITAGQARMTDDPVTDRLVTSTQKAIRISESLNTDDITTGICNQGTPMGEDGCVVYTQRIVNFVTSKCSGSCYIGASGPLPINTVISTFIKNTIAHEASHSMALTATYNNRFGGNHYQTGTNVVMDQSVYYTTKGTKTTFFIPGAYANADPSAVKLR